MISPQFNGYAAVIIGANQLIHCLMLAFCCSFIAYSRTLY